MPKEDTLDRYQELKKQAERLRRDHDREEGALRQHLKRLKDEFALPDEQEAEQWITAAERDLRKFEKEYARAERAFSAKWEEKLS
jgi:hypothetical protein